MPTIQKSMRIPEETIKELQTITEESGKDFSAITNELLQEAIKMRRCPGIIFNEGVSGRKAGIAGTGIEVWEIIAGYKSVDQDFQRLCSSYHWLTQQQLKSAIGYWKIYPDEIELLMSRNEDRTEERIYKTNRAIL